MKDAFHMSTQVFNGDYLTTQSRNILPHQFLLDDSYSQMKQSSEFNQSGRKMRGSGARNNFLGQSFQYINGPQIN